MQGLLVGLCLFAASFSATPCDDNLESYLNRIPASDPFSQWLEKSGADYPDFDTLPSHAPIPLPLAPVINGEKVQITDIAAWRAERERLLQELQHWILGTVPSEPGPVRAEILAEDRGEGMRRRELILHFGPDEKAQLWVELYIPDGTGPFPIFMSQDTHRGWAQIAVRRGYITCIYAGGDSRDDTDTFANAWPEYEWSRLMRRGWAAGRCLDYLETLPEADTVKTALTGHSRNGKTSLMGAAFDERIAVVISSSSGVGGSMASRYCGESQYCEGIEHITRTFPEWFHPRWRFFIGREHKVPVDLHHLAALAAPRPCLLSIAVNDGVEHTWALQHTYLAAKPVYQLYDAEDKLRIMWRSGGHETWAEIIEQYMDWCDLQFGRGDYRFEERFVYPWDWESWKANAKPAYQPDTASDDESVKDAEAMAGVVKKFLGEAPPQAKAPVMDYGTSKDSVLSLLSRSNLASVLERDQIVFGEYIAAEIYMPKGTQKEGAKKKAILYLPPLCAPTGYHASYRRGEQVYSKLARNGYVVFCFDPIAAGRRVEEAEHFYERHPNWSLLGKMVRDAQEALDAMVELPYVDPDEIWVVGYESGALTAMHLAALDQRPCGYGLVCPPLPYRLDTDVLETGGINRWAQERMVLPQLGLFSGKENQLPYDLDEILSLQAPKPLIMVTPQFDRFAPPQEAEKIKAILESAYAQSASPKNFISISPCTHNHFDESTQDLLLEQLAVFQSKESE
ncbi:MAG: dienelactone hydrolase family protein [Candidatus Hydrogenedentales bacterium]|jgi:hypothetical protein